jgi:hypothetical protein
MAKQVPGMFVIAAACLAVAAALGYGAFRAFAHGGGGTRLLAIVLTLGACLTTLIAVACVVLAFGVDFK